MDKSKSLKIIRWVGAFPFRLLTLLLMVILFLSVVLVDWAEWAGNRIAGEKNPLMPWNWDW